MTSTLPLFLRDMLASPPTAGGGVHGWLYRVSRQLHQHYSNKAEMARLLEACLATCGRVVPLREIEAAIRDSEAVAWKPDGSTRFVPSVTTPKWPEPNLEQIQAVTAEGKGLADLWELSPIHIADNDAHTEEIIDRLFPGNPLLCCGWTMAKFETRTREDWRGGISNLQLIVPSMMTTTTGLTKEGKESAHTLNNTGPRRFLIVEFDQGTTDQHAAILIHLANRAPLVMALHSGGKSMHGWFYCGNATDETLRKFFTHAVSLGADKATWTKSQFVRMPDGLRDNGKRQTVYFLNYRILEAKR